MQYQALRKVASSRLMLFTILFMLLNLVALPVFLFALMSSYIEFFPLDAARFIDVDLLLFGIVAAVSIPALAVSSLPIIAMFRIYFGARSDRPIRRGSFSLLRGYMIAMVVVESIETVFGVFLSDSTDYSVLLGTLGSVTSLLIFILSLTALEGARDVVTYGFTYRRIPSSMPVLMMISAGLSALVLLLTVLANTVSSLTEPLNAFRIWTAFAFYTQVGYAVIGLIGSVLFILLCIRGKNALAQRREIPAYFGN